MIGIVVPDEEVLIPWAKEKNIKGDFTELCQNEVCRSVYLFVCLSTCPVFHYFSLLVCLFLCGRLTSPLCNRDE